MTTLLSSVMITHRFLAERKHTNAHFTFAIKTLHEGSDAPQAVTRDLTEYVSTTHEKENV